ncbi:hypothetical protein MTX78_14545 [Hymenobacter tibetensis]|uniref:Uncharacterized protein n=1 Tax=Hymenobacter tibetensis TaxID=497967 RepID=A0ABY4CTI1_9BACT|nr:hypothetical protein [Hymenobacter tibetensis]UOG73342.1 hypothetical protein MTX78_14545 [Hymenobacter tibetensis]
MAGQAGGCRSKGLPAAEGNELRFYAGALLRLPDQRPLSTRCLTDVVTRGHDNAATPTPSVSVAAVSLPLGYTAACFVERLYLKQRAGSTSAMRPMSAGLVQPTWGNQTVGQ